MTSILISGAGIAGSSLALWAARYGLAATVVEAAPRLRVGGSAVDFRGRAHLRVLADMGVLDELRAVATGGTPMRFVDRDGRTRLDLPGDFAGGDLEVQRGDLVRIVYEHACPGAEFRFGERISELVDGRAGVEVTFASGARRRFDLVVGADGCNPACGAWPLGRSATTCAIWAITSPPGTCPTTWAWDARCWPTTNRVAW